MQQSMVYVWEDGHYCDQDELQQTLKEKKQEYIYFGSTQTGYKLNENKIRILLTCCMHTL